MVSRAFLFGAFRPAPLRLVSVCAALAAAAFFMPAHAADTVLHSFQGGIDGANPIAGLIADGQGALYSTTFRGGAANAGTVFKLAPPAPGQTQWTKTVLYSFSGGADGRFPAARLVFDSQGALYGTTRDGGAANEGTVFKLAPPAAGQTHWTETVLYSFTNVPYGDRHPVSGLIFDSHGTLYGAAAYLAGPATVFKLTPPDPGRTQWTETVLHIFIPGSDGAVPAGDLIFDSQGALYGTTYANEGTVFKLAPPAAGLTQWTETILHSFTFGSDGFQPSGGVVFDNRGALYGTTQIGGSTVSGCGPGCGTVFKLTPPADGQPIPWTYTVLYRFKGGSDGLGPVAGLTFDIQGVLYGTTRFGGSSVCKFGCGTVFELVPPAAGQTMWTETVLHRFTSGRDGLYPFAGLILDRNRALYGTTLGGGGSNHGTVFRVP
jgi:uncharacterized repeat protein (TIGR03803 family)